MAQIKDIFTTPGNDLEREIIVSCVDPLKRDLYSGQKQYKNLYCGPVKDIPKKLYEFNILERFYKMSDKVDNFVVDVKSFLNTVVLKKPILFKQTVAVHKEVTQDEINNCVTRFFLGDWGNISQDTSKANDRDLKNRSGRVLACYEISAGNLIIELSFNDEIMDEAVLMFSNEF